MYPHERSLVKNLAGKPFAIIGVNSDSNLEELKPTLKEENITWRSFWNGPKGTGGPISEAWNVAGWPTIYILDTEGKITYKGHGGPEMDKALEKTLADAGVEIDISELSEEDEDEDDDDDDDDKEDDDKSDDKEEKKSDKKGDKGE